MVAKIGSLFWGARQAKLIDTGARGGPRTHDLLLGKQMFYHSATTGVAGATGLEARDL